MAEQNPHISTFVQNYHEYGDGTGPFDGDDMREVADWQLEVVIEWLKANLMEYSPEKGHTYLDLFWDDAEIKVDLVVKRLEEAMRPQQEDN